MKNNTLPYHQHQWNYPESIQNLIRYHHKRNFGGIVNKMIAQVADLSVQTGSGKDIDPELLESLDLAGETVMEVYSRAMDSFSQIKSIWWLLVHRDDSCIPLTNPYE